MKTKLIAGLVVLALVATATGVVLARDNLGMQPPMIAHQWSWGPCGMDQLTEEERQEMQQQMEEFRQGLAEQYGIDLTDEERQEMQEQLQEKKQELRTQKREDAMVVVFCMLAALTVVPAILVLVERKKG